MFFVKADSKGVRSAFGVKAVDKGLTGAFFAALILRCNKRAGAGTAFFCAKKGQRHCSKGVSLDGKRREGYPSR